MEHLFQAAAAIVSLIITKLVNNIDIKFDKFEKKFSLSDKRINEKIQQVQLEIKSLKTSNDQIQARAVKLSMEHSKKMNDKVSGLSKTLGEFKDSYGKVIHIKESVRENSKNIDFQKRKFEELVKALKRK